MTTAPITPKTYVTTAKVAELLSVHPHTVKRIPSDELPYFTIGHRGDRRYDVEDVERYIEQRRRA